MQNAQYLITSALTFCADSNDIHLELTKEGRMLSVHNNQQEALTELNRYTIKMWNDTILDNFERFFYKGLQQFYTKSNNADEYDYDLIQIYRSDEELLRYFDKIQLKLFKITEIPNNQDYYVYWNNYSLRYATYPWEQDLRIVYQTYDEFFDIFGTEDIMIIGKNFNGKLKGTYEQLSHDPSALENLEQKCEWLSYEINSDGHPNIYISIQDSSFYRDTFDMSDFSKFNLLLKTPLYEIKKVSAQELCELQCKYTGQLIPELSLVI